MSMTTKQLAAEFDVPDNQAYTFVSVLKKFGLVEGISGEKGQNNKKGKPPTYLYRSKGFRQALSNLGKKLSEHLEPIPKKSAK